MKTASRDGYRCVLWSKVPFLRARTSSGSCSLQNKSSAQQFARSNFHLIHPFAPGKDPPKDIQGTRPAVRIHSARCQEVLNKWFESSSDGQPRPDWFQSKHKAKQRVGGPDAGEWKLIWHPRSRMDSPTVRMVTYMAAVTISSFTGVMLLFSLRLMLVTSGLQKRTPSTTFICCLNQYLLVHVSLSRD